MVLIVVAGPAALHPWGLVRCMPVTAPLKPSEHDLLQMGPCMCVFLGDLGIDLGSRVVHLQLYHSFLEKHSNFISVN